MKIIAALTLTLTFWSPGAFCETTGVASWYSVEACTFNSARGCPTADGTPLLELDRRGGLFAAYNDAPLGSMLRVTNRRTRKSVVCVVRDRGGFKKYGRKIDLSKAAFRKIANLRRGTTQVVIRKLGS